MNITIIGTADKVAATIHQVPALRGAPFPSLRAQRGNPCPCVTQPEPWIATALWASR